MLTYCLAGEGVGEGEGEDAGDDDDDDEALTMSKFCSLSCKAWVGSSSRSIGRTITTLLLLLLLLLFLLLLLCGGEQSCGAPQP